MYEKLFYSEIKFTKNSRNFMDLKKRFKKSVFQEKKLFI